MESRLDELESRNEITRLIHEYCRGADRRDLERFSAVWTDDGVWIAGDDPIVGISDIRAAIQRQWELIPEYHHCSSNIVINIHGEMAVAESDVSVAVRFNDGSWARSGGTYLDAFRRIKGLWYLAERDVGVGFSLDPLPEGFAP